MEINIHGLFPIPLFEANINRPLTEEEMTFFNSLEVTNGPVQQSLKDTYLLDNTILKDLRHFIEFCISTYKQEVMSCSDDVELYITQSWLNKMDTSNSMHKHTHPNSIISGVFYIQVEEEDSLIFLKQKKHQTVLFSPPSKPNPYNSFDFRMPSRTGNLLLFPSYLEHYVSNREKGERTRISLAFNTWFKGELFKPERLVHLKTQ